MAVVRPTKAVSATRKTLNASTKNWSWKTRMGPWRSTRRTSSAAATSVEELTATLSSGALRRAPKRASNTNPRRGKPSTASSSKSILLEVFHVAQIEAPELLADLKEEKAENEDADQ